jgi:hypothetical protein
LTRELRVAGCWLLERGRSGVVAGKIPLGGVGMGVVAEKILCGGGGFGVVAKKILCVG